MTDSAAIAPKEAIPVKMRAGTAKGKEALIT